MAAGAARVLVVDDNEMNRDVLSRRLGRHGYQVDVAEDGQAALAIVAEAAYDLLLLDIMMPKLDGYAVLEQLKADDRTRHIPVIMISAVDDLKSVVRCIELGAEDYLFKPFNPVLLKARVDATIKKANRLDPAATTTHLMEMQQAVISLTTQGTLDATQQAQIEILQQHLDALQTMID